MPRGHHAGHNAQPLDCTTDAAVLQQCHWDFCLDAVWPLPRGPSHTRCYVTETTYVGARLVAWTATLIMCCTAKGNFADHARHDAKAVRGNRSTKTQGNRLGCMHRPYVSAVYVHGGSGRGTSAGRPSRLFLFLFFTRACAAHRHRTLCQSLAKFSDISDGQMK